MSGSLVRVAVQEGAETVRIAGAEADGAAWRVAELPAPGPGTAALLAELVGPAPQELVLVHPGWWSDARAVRWGQDCAGLAARVRAVPAPLAAAGRGGVAVLDVGAAGTEAALLDVDGRVRAAATADVGGRRLDELLAARWGRGPSAVREVRDVREALSLLPAVDGIDAADLQPVLAGALGAAVRALQDVLAGAGAGPVPVLLVGGVARTPLLARLVDEAGITGAVVAPCPDAAAVLGALALPAGAGLAPASHTASCGAGDASTGTDGHRAAREVDALGSEPGRADPAGGCGDLAEEGLPRPDPASHGPLRPARWLPPLPPRRRRPLRTVLFAVAAAAVVVALLAVGRIVAPPAPGAVPAGVLVQYDYRFDVPAGWKHTGGSPERRRVLLTPVDAPDGSDLIVVERSPLGYDAGAEPERAQAELRAAFEAAVAGGSVLTGYDAGARFAGRAVTSYRQEQARTVVDWFVVLDGDAQLSVGCRHTAAGSEAVRAACTVVVASVRPS